MNDSKLVQILHTRNYLLKEANRLLLFHLLVLHDIVEKLATGCKLSDQVKLLGCFNNFIELNDVRMTDEL